MLDFKALANTRQKLEQSNQVRNRHGQELYQQACQLLESYRSSGDARLLPQAIKRLCCAIEQSRRFAEPYLMLAYLYHALDQTTIALKYLQSAEAIAPGTPFAQSLREQIAEGQKIPVTEPGPETVSEHQNVEQNYERVQAFLQQLLVRINGSEALLPSAQPKHMLTLQERHQQWLQITDLLFAELRQLETEFDTGTLQRQAQQVNHYLGSLERVLTQSEDFVKVQAQLQALNRQVQELIQELQPGQEVLIESLYDACDQIADQLDDFSEKQLLIDEFQPDYERLLQGVQQLQERLDEL